MGRNSASADSLRFHLESASWLPARGPFRAFDQQWRIATTDRALAQHLDDLYAGARVAEGATVGSGVTYRVLPVDGEQPGILAREAEVLISARDPARLLGRLIWTINRQVIDNSVAPLLLHAACARLDDACVLLPAAMEAGKTTLVAGLIDRGAVYLTDEAAAIDEHLMVEGFAKPLSIDAGSWTVLPHHEPTIPPALRAYHRRQWQVPAPRVTRRGRLSLIVFPSYEAGSSTRLERLEPIQALERALPCTFAQEGETVPARKVAMLASIVTEVPCYTLVLDDLDAACCAILNLLSDLPP